jgi:hypothetical protein
MSAWLMISRAKSSSSFDFRGSPRQERLRSRKAKVVISSLLRGDETLVYQGVCTQMALWSAAPLCRANRSDTWPHQPALQRHPKTQWSAVHAGSNSRVRSLLRESCRNAYGSFQAHSARTESNSGMRASGRFGLLAKQPRNGRRLRKADVSKRR